MLAYLSADLNATKKVNDSNKIAENIIERSKERTSNNSRSNYASKITPNDLGNIKKTDDLQL
jgi:hypothetical protein